MLADGTDKVGVVSVVVVDVAIVEIHVPGIGGIVGVNGFSEPSNL